ncbi:hypothetical protein VNO77_09271 [Canavalia gladiata]|uniref:Uncharacterized protein n=1 Tax=Canavalia gladiata TaxID=3824 RepID=A0AAN9R1D2_CANGL
MVSSRCGRELNSTSLHMVSLMQAHEVLPEGDQAFSQLPRTGPPLGLLLRQEPEVLPSLLATEAQSIQKRPPF